MRLANAAIGLAAVGAGFLVARALKARRAGYTEYVGARYGGKAAEPPDPSQLIGHPLANVSAREAAEIFDKPANRRM